MSFSQNLLYLLLLYAVLDRGNKLSLNTGLIIAFVILLFNCYFGNRCCNGSRKNKGDLAFKKPRRRSRNVDCK